MAITSEVIAGLSGRRYYCPMNSKNPSVGTLLRTWRRRRALSQLDLASDADISQRHLSFVESGRALPSRDMLLRLAEQLDIPLRERNALLIAGGYAPVYRERDFSDPEIAAARQVVELILRGHEPYPALAVDRHWTLLAANQAAQQLLAGIDAGLLQPPVNVLRVSMHPQGLASRIVNLREWRAHVLSRLSQQIDNSADSTLMALLDELKHYPIPAGTKAATPDSLSAFAGLAVPLELRTEAGVLSFLSTTTVFGTPVDISLSELAIESFFPADEQTAAVMQQLAQQEQAESSVG